MNSLLGKSVNRTRQFIFNVILRRLCDHCCRGKAVIIKHCECVFVGLIIQHVTRMRRFILSSLACPSVPYFSNSHKRHDFQKNTLLKIKLCFDFIYNFCLKYFYFYEEMYVSFLVKYPLFSSESNET
jgi:hypothetical protein